MKKYLGYIIVILISFGVATLIYFVLPDQIPIQKTIEGVRYANKAFVFIFAVIPILIYAKVKRK